MELYVWRGTYPNFGDELNEWLLPKIFPGLFDDDKSSDLFLGIGSVLFDSHPADRRKVVFGAGYGGYTPKPVIDRQWKFYCVRGPHTAETLGLPESLVAADAAVLLNRFRTARPKTIKQAFMPHWESIGRGQWARACEIAGVHYLDPGRPVGELIAEIEASELVMAEAMHGAIVADALRTPWIAVTPFDTAHRRKWRDWSDALGVALRQHRLPPSSAAEHSHARYGDHAQHRPSSEGSPKPAPGALMAVRRSRRAAIKVMDAVKLRQSATKVLDAHHLRRAASALQRLGRQAPTLSTDAAMAAAVGRLEVAAAAIRRDYALSR